MGNQRIITRDEIKEILSLYKHKTILDIGPSTNALESATHVLDYQDNSTLYPEIFFYTHDLNNSKTLPFDDNYFDFVYSSHVLEHLDDPINVLNEIGRVGKTGVIIVPTKFSDNLYSIDAVKLGDVYLNDRYGHKWWFDFGINASIHIEKRQRILRRVPQTDLSVRKLFNHMPNLYELCFYWSENIQFNKIESNEKKNSQVRIGYGRLNIISFLLLKLNDSFLDTYETLISFLRKLKYFLKSRKNRL